MDEPQGEKLVVRLDPQKMIPMLYACLEAQELLIEMHAYEQAKIISLNVAQLIEIKKQMDVELIYGKSATLRAKIKEGLASDIEEVHDTDKMQQE